MPVALRHPIGSALTGRGADRGGELGLDQLLQRGGDDVAQRRGQRGIRAEQTRGKVG